MAADIRKEIETIEDELDTLPQGYVAKKTVNGKDYYYRRIKSGTKYVEIPIEPDAVENTKSRVARRKELEKRLKELNALAGGSDDEARFREAPPRYNMNVSTGDDLADTIKGCGELNRRDCFEKLKDYVYGDSRGKVFILYGLRRTGKSTLMWQVIADMDEKHFAKTAYIKTGHLDGLAVLNKDMGNLYRHGYRYVFIDEVTLMPDFVEGASLLSDVYAGYGMKIVLSGTDSLSFMFAADGQLYDRYRLVHTTFIPYREFERVLGIKGIDEYIRYGGTMSKSGDIYNEGDSSLHSQSAVNKYVDTAIAENIQNSLKNYQHEGHFRQLEELYRKHELTNAINRVVEDMNHRFAVDVITRAFRSNDLASSASILRNENDVLDKIDRDAFHDSLRKMLGILNPSEQTVPISESQVTEIKEYLEFLDMTHEVDLINQLGDVKKINVISQPGLRYAQAEALIDSLLTDPTFVEMSTSGKDFVKGRILSEIRGRMMEEIILLETRLATPKNVDVFKLQFKSGEFDMVVLEHNTYTCKIYEIKHSDKVVPLQYKYLEDGELCGITEQRYGKIVGKYVIYRGETCDVGDIHYLNVEEYLRAL
ncbi:MAG: AAA family ATPase [Clostridia bacterium]|nr:AAA family ATPase [Clostridia bacterium]